VTHRIAHGDRYAILPPQTPGALPAIARSVDALRAAVLEADALRGQTEANRTHREVGETVRGTIKELGGTMPEDEPALEHIRQAQKRLKQMAPVELGRPKHG